MKKLSLLCLALGLVTSSCSTSKLAKQTQNEFRGDWTLVSVQPREKGVSVTQLFNQASTDCFIGSHWHLVANNNSGTYILNETTCPSGKNMINWHTTEEDGIAYFWFKQIAQGEKAKNVKSGYKMRIESISETQAQLSQEVPLDNGKTTIDYYFIKK